MAKFVAHLKLLACFNLDKVVLLKGNVRKQVCSVCGLLYQIMIYPVFIYLSAWLQLRLCTSSYPWYKSGMWRKPTPHYSTILLRIASTIAHWKVWYM